MAPASFFVSDVKDELKLCWKVTLLFKFLSSRASSTVISFVNVFHVRELALEKDFS